jgi:hypothetical protein
MSEDDPRLTFISIEKATDSPDGLVWCRKNMWWVVHPEKRLSDLHETLPSMQSQQGVRGAPNVQDVSVGRMQIS